MNNKYTELSKNKPSDVGVIMFDSTCVMCNMFVQFLLKHNKKENLFFTSIDSPKAKELKSQYDIDPDYKESMIYIFQQNCYIKSTGCFQIMKQLDMPFKWLYYISYITIKPIGDWLYHVMATNRFLFNQNRSSCSIIHPHQPFRFI